MTLEAENFKPQELSMTLWAYAKLQRSPGAEVSPVLHRVTRRLAPALSAQSIANILWAHATLPNGALPADVVRRLVCEVSERALSRCF